MGQRDAGMRLVIIAPVTWTCVGHLKKNEAIILKRAGRNGAVFLLLPRTLHHTPPDHNVLFYMEQGHFQRAFLHTPLVETVLSCQFFRSDIQDILKAYTTGREFVLAGMVL